MFSSFLLLSLASVHSFCFVAATPDPKITDSPKNFARQTPQSSSFILSTVSYQYPDVPYQVDPFPVGRGPQSGYNQCNSSTEGQNSLCQTMFINNIADFCLWGSPVANGTIGDQEAAVVAYCTKSGHGTRLIPGTALNAVQFMRTSAYIQVVGLIKNAALDLTATDSGGELDPHGADLAGNPLGGLVFSNATSSDGSINQISNWNLFVGSDTFCFKACFNNQTEPDYCQNVYDLVGCDYNMPSNVTNGTYTSCEGDLQDVVGVYTTDGTVSTWSMPQTLLSPPPYQPRIPASSNCVTYDPSSLYVFPSTTSATTHATATTTGPSGSGGSRSGTGAGATSTSTSAQSSALHAIGVPPAFYALGLGIIAGIALVL